ncbi:MAG: toxin-antitoxin system YwqK family antitoxin [Myxococcaceae bacterium]
MLSLILLTTLAAEPLQCPPGSTARTTRSSTSEWVICEKPPVNAEGEGVREGPMLFISDGHVASRMNYRDGEEDGEQINYAVSGKPVTIKRFRAGKQHGLSETWDSEGAKRTQEEWQDGERHGRLRYWRADGTLIVESEWRRGEPVRFTAYYPNGKKRSEALSPLPNTKITEWDEAGNVTKVVLIENGLERGYKGASDSGMLSCPKENFAKVTALGVGYPADRCGGYPEPSADGTRTETFAWAPRSARKALTDLGCTFTVTRTAEDAERQTWDIYFASHAEVGE